ncbi:MAG TPA: hypothetical protein DDY77_04415 [Clostridiales bacterium]|nr:hypothetical protein [Clostridiales bacterium]
MEKTICTHCGKHVDYVLAERKSEAVIKNEKVIYNEKYAVCAECGEEVYAEGLDDINVLAAIEAYEKTHDLITVSEIEKLLKTYDIGKKPLSLLLGWGEVTLTRFLEGQIPTVQYSEQLKALKNADCFSKLLEKNGSRITPTAYKKAKAALENSKQAEKIDISKFALLKPYPQYAYNITFKGGFACTNHSCPC